MVQAFDSLLKLL